jgi:Uri superfamily endonuclease
MVSMSKGVYVLVISVRKDTAAEVGALGRMSFRRGLYLYVGSAQSNLEKRIDRHLRKDKRKFWHIDYLLGNSAVEILRVFYKKAGKSEECEIARKIVEQGVPVKGFGCSDCSCKSHLFWVKGYQFLNDFMLRLL